ncbi:hypothetical protein GCK72_016523 [Caenorhabditis remanei]|uniref:Uncharacterized protein n=1 Tax=Caenorhabditis remanei TaxID=31234 RepID=A0A6A5G4N6_CAERE|nr:hypothetical protein GCK72_016523 [Caenorhabditis remanei]KAF1749978.1 hypothetical protein GCK72_016523 [Caenorhabditis remanei]
MEEEDIYYWSKHSRPSPNQDHIRHSLAEYVLHPLKIRASILKSIYIPIPSDHLQSEYSDFQPNILYSLNRKRRWEAEDSIGVDLLEELTQLNKGWRVTVVERKQARNYEFPLCFAAAFYLYSHYFEDLYPVMKFCYLKDNKEYKEKSVRGQVYKNFLGQMNNFEESDDDPIASYNFLRPPANIVTLMKKRFQSRDYNSRGWQRDGYWNRLDRKKDRYIQLRYEELENLDGGVWNDGLDNNVEEVKVKYYNLEDHLVEKFVMVKKRRSGKKGLSN